jgi:protein O-mannosyl-transferase
MAKQRLKKEKYSAAEISVRAFTFASFNFRTVILIAVGLILYANTLFNEYALDDGIVIEKNEYVQEGLRGIPKILSTDAYESFYRSMNASQQLAGGRYRPLSIVTFAIEQQFFGSKEKMKPQNDLSTLRHFMNVALYILSIIALFYFLLHFLLKDKPDAAFLTALIFLIHPIHTEVIANVKSRDEILSFLFIVLTFISIFRYNENHKKRTLISGLVFYFLALLSKEYAVTLIFLIPILFYIVRKDPFIKSITSAIPFFIVAFVYLIIRYKIVGKGATTENTDVLNNPYMYATATEKLATQIEVLNHYLKLLFYPYPLSSDYSYSSIPYTDFSNPRVWLSIFIHLGMIITTIILFFKRNILAFALSFYLLHLALVCNLIFGVGATMGERLVYHSSFGFAVIIGIVVNWLIEKQSKQATRKAFLIAFSLLVTIASAAVVIPRNLDWKNDDTLFIKDAETVPNSALVNGNAGKAYVDLSEMPENKEREKELILKAIYHLSKAVSVHTKYVNGYLNLGVCYYKLKDYDKAKENWDQARVLFPNNPYLKTNYPLLGQAYLNEALRIGFEKKDPRAAIPLLEKAVESDPYNAEIWYNLGGACYTINDFQRAREAFLHTLELKPDHEKAKQGLAAIPQQ